jgi:hypothetical protein
MMGTSSKPRSNQILIFLCLTIGWEHTIVPDELKVSAPRFQIFRLDLDAPSRELEMKQRPIGKTDFERLPAGGSLITFTKVAAFPTASVKFTPSSGGVFLARFSSFSRSFTSSIFSGESKSSS